MSSCSSVFVALLHGACLACEAEIERELRRTTKRTIWEVWTIRGHASLSFEDEDDDEDEDDFISGVAMADSEILYERSF